MFNDYGSDDSGSEDATPRVAPRPSAPSSSSTATPAAPSAARDIQGRTAAFLARKRAERRRENQYLAEDSDASEDRPLVDDDENFQTAPLKRPRRNELEGLTEEDDNDNKVKIAGFSMPKNRILEGLKKPKKIGTGFGGALFKSKVQSSVPPLPEEPGVEESDDDEADLPAHLGFLEEEEVDFEPPPEPAARFFEDAPFVAEPSFENPTPPAAFPVETPEENPMLDPVFLASLSKKERREIENGSFRSLGRAANYDEEWEAKNVSYVQSIVERRKDNLQDSSGKVETGYQVAAGSTETVSRNQKQKHQITFLAAKVKAEASKLEGRLAEGKNVRNEAGAKYGW